MERTEVTEHVKALSQGYLDDNSIELVEIMYRREGGGMVLRLLVDTPEGIRIDECEALNKFLSETLDKEDLIQDSYTIEVSSPGLDRHLVTDRDFERVISKEIEATTYDRIHDRKTHDGRLIGMDKEMIVIESGGISTVIPRKSIAVARLKIEI
ncbi:MAG: ribosome maturation factor RimP [Candidatus Omnitrophica bacterium]|nr:ribosome maturation factor RimP [Candidatus Omnitrophota bacterium]